MAKKSEMIEAAMRRHPERVREYWYEKEDDQWWVCFKSGWRISDNPGQHTISGSQSLIAQEIRNAKPCDCGDCHGS